MRMDNVNVREQAVQDFLWKYLEPSDFRHDYTKLDAIKEVERMIYAGECQLLGDMDEGIVFRVVERNPKIVEPHIMGDGTKIRTALDVGVAYAWACGYEKVVITTQHEKIARIVEKCGFIRAAMLPAMFMASTGDLVDLHTLVMEKDHAL